MMTEVEVEIQGQRLVGGVAVSGSTTWFSLAGEVWTLDSDTDGGAESRSSRRSGKTSQKDPGQIVAPMPGKIIKVLVQAGNLVHKGDTLVVMEAMKMEYTLKALSDGKVKSVQCATSEQVVLGAVLVELEITNVANGESKT